MNERLARVGRGTPAGELLRRYWQPIALASQLGPQRRARRARVLGEDLVIAVRDDGSYACYAEHCAHRGCSLLYGFLESDGVRCPYHGWKFDYSGQCIEQPFEPSETYKRRIRIDTYPVRRRAGVLFGYLGPPPVPLLPPWDVTTRRDGWRGVWLRGPLRCNWLQIQENTADTTHTYFLHGRMLRELDYPGGERHRIVSGYYERPIVGYDFGRSPWGVSKTLVYGGDQPGREVFPPMILPNILRIGDGVRDIMMHWRVPVDDEQTLVYEMTMNLDEGLDLDPDDSVRESAELPRAVGLTADGEYDLLTFETQDRMAWETQGAITDRSREHLGASDRGIALFRRLLAEDIDRVERGEVPSNVLHEAPPGGMIEFTFLRPEHATGVGPDGRAGSV